MLQSLHVKNLALIDEAEVNFENGLNILSGETGAGKSIIIGSMNMALGEKASKDMVRHDADYAFVELIFHEQRSELIEKLKELDVFPEDGQIIMSRKIMPGRSLCKINSETVSASLMRSVASLLIDIHGQHEHQSLLSKKNHLKYLDDFAKLDEDKAELREAYHSYQEKKRLLEEASMDEESQARELSFLQFEINEIEQAHLMVGEDEELESRYRTLSHGRKIMEAAGTAYEMTGNAMENASSMVGRAVRELISVSDYDETVQTLADQLGEIDNLLSDFNRDLSGYLSDADFSEEQFAEVAKRLDEINHLKSKYGDSIEKILAQKKEKEARVEQLLNYDAYRSKLEAEYKAATAEVKVQSDILSVIRKKEAKTLVKEVTQALIDLNFLEVRFDMRFETLDHFTANGIDDARFYISTNPGEELKPLEQVASGGELSRIMLALKTVLAENDEIETLIFDEIDSGISGRTAQMVAEKMKQTGKNHQIICITHLPQIAAMADTHFLIEKTTEGGSTVSNIRTLSEEESIQELARMLGGVKITDTVIQSAREMKEMANAAK
ncbi:MAG: DNA repair protein RecN [Eubacterium sp.]|nr:DNA repair protein RecN [Eubacterium sp.]